MKLSYTKLNLILKALGAFDVYYYGNWKAVNVKCARDFYCHPFLAFVVTFHLCIKLKSILFDILLCFLFRVFVSLLPLLYVVTYKNLTNLLSNLKSQDATAKVKLKKS